MMQHNQIYEQLMPGRLFARCAFPSMVSMAVTSLYTVADGIFVGRMIGADALAAINLVMPLIIMSFALADMVAAGSSVQISIRLGERREGEACRIFSFCSLLIVAISCAAGAGGLLMAEPLVRLMGAGHRAGRAGGPGKGNGRERAACGPPASDRLMPERAVQRH